MKTRLLASGANVLYFAFLEWTSRMNVLTAWGPVEVVGRINKAGEGTGGNPQGG